MRDVLFALDRLKASPLAETLCFDEVQARARETVIGNAKSVREQVVMKGQQPLQIALNLIVNLCGRDLGSGNDHTYRGVLSTRGTAKRALFNHAQALMLERGYIEQEDVDYGQAALAEQIKEAG
ncbi:MAG: hypothetical protein WC804_15170 [Sphingomonas sp.]|uniref:hypothetical protein n=1 Tax=Sphingomonas sp. TaxID=28214 RepID=UPI003569FAE1